MLPGVCCQHAMLIALFNDSRSRQHAKTLPNVNCLPNLASELCHNLLAAPPSVQNENENENENTSEIMPGTVDKRAREQTAAAINGHNNQRSAIIEQMDSALLPFRTVRLGAELRQSCSGS